MPSRYGVFSAQRTSPPLVAYYGGEDYDGKTPQAEMFSMKFLELLEANDVDYARREVDRLLSSGEYGCGYLVALAGIANHYGDAGWQAEITGRFVGNRTNFAD